MADKTGLALRGRNPDVSSCIANLSNDEVFTSPELANQEPDRRPVRDDGHEHQPHHAPHPGRRGHRGNC
jgi:hypothetical protein